MRSSIYSVHPGVLMVQRAIAGLSEKTGRLTHRIEIAALDDIDAGVVRWMTRAYEMDA